MELEERLESAYEDSDFDTKRAFQRRMKTVCEEAGIRGGSHPTIHRYFEGHTSPKQEWLQLAAEELGVRYEWLATGQGEPTQLEQALHDAAASATDPDRAGSWRGMSWWSQRLESKVREAAPDLCGEGVPARLETAFWACLEAYGETEIGRDLTLDRTAEVARMLQSATLTPLSILQGVRPDYSTSSTLDFEVALLNALTSLFRAAE